jgi:dolichyl-phosphate beta-glucosyltransferase
LKNTSFNLRNFIRYIVVGSITTSVDFLLFFISYKYLLFSVNVSVFIAFIGALVFSFIANKLWTFKDNNLEKKWSLQQFLKFFFVATTGLLLSIFLMKILTDILNIDELISKMLTSGMLFIWNFIMNSFWTFKPLSNKYIDVSPENKNFNFELSIVIPAYNEEKRIKKTLKSCIDFFSLEKINYEIIIVDDGSEDKTIDIVKQSFKYFKDYRIINLKNNKGKGYAVKTGVLESLGRYILFCDADGSTPFYEYKKLKEAMVKNHIAIGSRYKNRETVEKKQPFYRTLISRIINIISQIFLIEGILDTQCGFKMFRNDVGKKIFRLQKIERFAFDIEFLMLCKLFNYQIVEIPVKWSDTPGTKVKMFKDGIRAMRDFLYIKFNMMFNNYK